MSQQSGTPSDLPELFSLTRFTREHRTPQILLVDDDPSAILMLAAILKDIAEIRFATDGATALKLAHAEQPDLILLDIEMPEMSGIEVCEALKADASLVHIPVVFITGHATTADELAGLAAGAVDFIAKPPLAPLVQARVRTHLRLKLLTDSLRQSALVDPLTGIGNRRQLESALGKEWLRTLREATPIALMMIDVDYFKQYNDTYGHQAGDLCLRQIVSTVSAISNADAEMFNRYGGDEFALILPNCDAETAQQLAGQLIAGVASLGLPHHGSPISAVVTVTIGVSAYSPTASKIDAPDHHRVPLVIGPDDLLVTADRALYCAKEAGRMQVCVKPLDPGSPLKSVAEGTSHRA